MSGFEEAVAWFRERDVTESLDPRYLTHDALEHAAVIVRRVVEHTAAPDEPREDAGAVLRDELEAARDYFAREIDALAHPEVSQAARRHAAVRPW